MQFGRRPHRSTKRNRPDQSPKDLRPSQSVYAGLSRALNPDSERKYLNWNGKYEMDDLLIVTHFFVRASLVAKALCIMNVPLTIRCSSDDANHLWRLIYQTVSWKYVKIFKRTISTGISAFASFKSFELQGKFFKINLENDYFRIKNGLCCTATKISSQHYHFLSIQIHKCL